MSEIEVGEIWKDIKGYEGKYQISNYGRVKSLQRNLKYIDSKKITEKLKGTFVGKRGYARIELSKDGINKKYSVHRLVAQAFIPNPNKKLEVNHINGIKTDNRVSNLEWVTSKENQIHAIKYGLQRPSLKQKRVASEYCKKNKIKALLQYDLDGNFIRKWESAVEVEKELKINRKNISQCVTGRNHTAGGFIWKYMANCYKVGGEDE